MLREVYQEDGERGYVSLRAFDGELKRPTVRTGECVVSHGRVPEPIIAVPAALGTVNGQWSTAASITVTGEHVFKRYERSNFRASHKPLRSNTLRETAQVSRP